MGTEFSRQMGMKVKCPGILEVAILMDEISALANSPRTKAGFFGKDSALCFNKESSEPETMQSAEANMPLQSGVKYSEGDADKSLSQAGKCAHDIEWLYRLEAINQSELKMGQECQPAINSNILVMPFVRNGLLSTVGLLAVMSESCWLPIGISR